MRPELLDVLVAPTDRAVLRLDAGTRGDRRIMEGTLISQHGRRFPIEGGVARMGTGPADGAVDQEATAGSFGAKWASYREAQRRHLPAFQYRWFDARYGFGDDAGLARFLSGKRWVLDAGSGPGFHTSRYARLSSAQVVGLELSETATAAAREFADVQNLSFVQGDILNPPFGPASFDFVVADQVIHHTPDCPRAFRTLAELVRAGGELAVYVYRRKALLRELADDKLRELTTGMSVDDCMEFSQQVTELGRELSRLGATVKLERGIPLLGIDPGEHDVQRLIYWHFLKCFWNEELGEEISQLVNFDWYHPPYASRHTEEEVLGWCRDAGLDVVHKDVGQSGISLRAARRE
jgi:SAM-dependent methyltransferase/uncharacterized protein YbaR (Trm112 family)